MEDIKQILVINKALQKQKKGYLSELARTNMNIEKKYTLIRRMAEYIKEYMNDDKFTISKQVPTLNKNLNSFTMQIEEVIEKTEIEIEALKQNCEIIMRKIEKADQKIKLMELFENRVKIAAIMKAEKKEQLAMDDLSATKHMRDDYE